MGILLSGSRLVAATNKKILTYEVDSSSSLVQAEELTVKDVYGKVTYRSDNSDPRNDKSINHFRENNHLKKIKKRKIFNDFPVSPKAFALHDTSI